MPQATFWFSSPFKEWVGQRTLTLSWEGSMTLRKVWERLAADCPKLRTNLPREGLQEEAMSHLVAVIVDGDILTLDAQIKDGAKVDVLTPLSGGAGNHLPIFGAMPEEYSAARAGSPNGLPALETLRHLDLEWTIPNLPKVNGQSG